MKTVFIRFLILLTLLSLLPAQANIFGDDTRKVWDASPTKPYPLNRVGTLKRPDGKRCTATYIGDNQILTAAHCIMKHGRNRLLKGNYLFEHSQNTDGAHQNTRTITRFHYIELKQLEDKGITNAKFHWAILELSSPISEPKRFFGYSYPGDEEYDEYHESNYELSIIGFSPEFNNRSQKQTFSASNCDIKEHLLDGYVALHDCDSGPRDSGAPLYKCSTDINGSWVECNIHALHVGAFSIQGIYFDQYSKTNANVAVTVKSFKKTIYYLKMGGIKPYNLVSTDNS